MNDFQEIKNLWNEFYKLPFPAVLAGEEIKGIDITSLDTFAAGCVETFIDNKGLLDEKRKEILENCRKDLEVVIEYLDEEAKFYFEKLSFLIEKILLHFKSENQRLK